MQRRVAAIDFQQAWVLVPAVPPPLSLKTLGTAFHDSRPVRVQNQPVARRPNLNRIQEVGFVARHYKIAARPELA